MKKLSAAQKERAEFLAQIRALEKALRLKDQQLQEAAREVRYAREELKQARELIAQWRKHMDDVQKQIEKMEQENLDSVEAGVAMQTDETDRASRQARVVVRGVVPSLWAGERSGRDSGRGRT